LLEIQFLNAADGQSILYARLHQRQSDVGGDSWVVIPLFINVPNAPIIYIMSTKVNLSMEGAGMIVQLSFVIAVGSAYGQSWISARQ
jgi:hypothetical protein